MRNDSRGFSLIELVFAIGILAVAVLGLAGVMAGGMRHLTGSPSHVVAAQKAAEAVEDVFAARDSHKLTWDRIKNVAGASGNDDGVFVDGAQQMRTAGDDGLVNTGDDPSTIESTVLPGPDGAIGTSDDREIVLDGFTREITIRDVPNEGGQLRSITVTISYRAGNGRHSYTLVTYISSYA